MLKVDAVQIDTDTREVRCNNQRIDLEPKVYELLVHLIRHRDRVVSKEELLEQVWPGRVVSDDALYRAVRLARDVFSDTGLTEPAIKTVHRVGYRFNAPVVEGAQNAAAESALHTTLALAGALDELDLTSISIDGELESGPHCVSVSSVAEALSLALRFQVAQGVAAPGMAIHVSAPLDERDEQPRAVARAIAKGARPGQILLSATAFELARTDPEASAASSLIWLAHGPYHLGKADEIVTLFEVGISGAAPLRAPEETDAFARAHTDDLILGWRAARGQEIPHRRHWMLADSLGAGGFGEAWLAEHSKTQETRVFKFCFRADRLKSLQREVTLFRLLNETLGARDDIARILDWNFDEPPYFIESEFTAEGDLVDWARRQGGLEQVPMKQRLKLIAQTAQALAAAHAVGVLHKDVKPTNILIKPGIKGSEQAVLADFGIGLITDADPLIEHSITQLGVTEALAGNVTTARTGTRRYMAPELLEGKPPTLQADIYSLGVVLYQLVVGDFDRVLAPGWERDVQDSLLREDIAAMVDGDPAQRPADAMAVARSLLTLEARRSEKHEQQAQQERLERERKRRRILVPITAFATIFAVAMAIQSYRINQQKERAQAEARRAEEVTAFMKGLFDAGNPMYRGGSPPTLEDFLNSGANQLSQELSAEPYVRSTLLVTLSSAFRAMDKLDRAEALLADALVDAEKSGDWYMQGGALFELAKIAIERNELEEASSLLARAQALIPPGGGFDAEIFQSNLYQGYARVTFLRGEYEQSVAHVRDVVQVRRKLLERDDPRLADGISNLAGNLFLLGSEHYEESVELFAEAITLFRSHNPKHYGFQATLANMGIALETLGRFEESAQHLEQAISLADEIFGGPHPATAWALQTMGQVQQELGQRDQALTYLNRSYEIRRDMRGEHPETGLILLALTDFHLAGGDLSQAADHASECLRIRRAVAPEGHWVVAEASHRVGMILLEQNRIDEAADYLPAASSALLDALGETNWFNGQALIDLARLQVAQGDADSALDNGRRGVAILLNTLGADNAKTTYGQLQWVRVLADAGRQDEARSLLDQLWPAAQALEVTAPYRFRQLAELRKELAGNA